MQQKPYLPSWDSSSQCKREGGTSDDRYIRRTLQSHFSEQEIRIACQHMEAGTGSNANVVSPSRPLASIHSRGEAVQPTPIPRGMSGEAKAAQQTKKRSDYAGLAHKDVQKVIRVR
jgi:hypothetical protein